jgi:hypothetical protein
VRLLAVDKEHFYQKNERWQIITPVRESVFLSQISAEEFGSIEEYLYEFKGFYTAISPVREDMLIHQQPTY